MHEKPQISMQKQDINTPTMDALLQLKGLVAHESIDDSQLKVCIASAQKNHQQYLEEISQDPLIAKEIERLQALENRKK